MGSLFGRKGRNETNGRREGVGKKSAAVLAAVAVAGGSAVVGMPQAEAAAVASYLYFEKVDQDGNPLGGSEWVFEYGETPEVSRNRRVMEASGSKAYESFKVVDNLNLKEQRVKDEDRVDEDGYLVVDDYDPRPGHIAIWPAYWGLPEFIGDSEHRFHMEEDSAPEGYESCGGSVTSLDFYKHSGRAPLNAYTRTGDGAEPNSYRYSLREHGFLEPISSSGKIIPVTDERIMAGTALYVASDMSSALTGEYSDTGYNPLGYLPETVDVPMPPDGEEFDPSSTFIQYVFDDSMNIPEEQLATSHNLGVAILPLGAFVNCKITPETAPPTVTETTTVTQPVTTTVTPPTTTVTLPSTVTTTVTPPPATVTETPKTETTTATTTESAMTTVTEPAKTETVTETPQRETVTETPAPKTETVTETPQKETVTETPKASTETMTSTVTAPQVTVTETPNQVTETTTLPQKTVTQQVPTTVVKDQTETVKMPPVTVTETEKQEPVTVTVTPQNVTETLTVPGENTTVVVTEPGEPTTVRETVTEETTSVVPVVVDNPKPSVPVPAPAPAPEQPVETPVEVKQEPANGVRRVLATTGAETNVLFGLGAGVLAMLALVAIVRRKKA